MTSSSLSLASEEGLTRLRRLLIAALTLHGSSGATAGCPAIGRTENCHRLALAVAKMAYESWALSLGF
jgi:hypothetical protein